MKPIQKKTIEKYETMLQTGNFSEKDVIYFRSILNTKLRDDADTRKALVSKFNALQLTVSEEQKAKGIAWLTKTNLKANGSLRSNAILGLRESHILSECVKIEVELVDKGRAGSPNYLPLYRVYGAESFFEYVGNQVTG